MCTGSDSASRLFLAAKANDVTESCHFSISDLYVGSINKHSVLAEDEADRQLPGEKEDDLSFNGLYGPVRALFCGDPQLLDRLAECRTHLSRLQLLTSLQVWQPGCSPLPAKSRYGGRGVHRLQLTPGSAAGVLIIS